jgi:hypothetical protein
MIDPPEDDVSEFFSQIQENRNQVVIFGAGVAGEALFHVCKDSGTEPVCFCDNNTYKTNKLLCGIPVRHISEIGKNLDHPVFLISAADIVDVVEQLESLEYQNWYDCSLLLQDFEVHRHTLSVPSDFAEYVISTCSVCHQAFRNPHGIFLRSVDIVITERCSLRCRDCANLMQYYMKPKNYPLEDILKSVHALSEIVDSVNELRVIGGEPLMSPVFTDVLETLIAYSKFRRIIIYTNGTICPSKQILRNLRHPKVLFFITDYGTLSKNLEPLKIRLDDLGIQQYVQPAQGWCDCGTVKWHKRDEHERMEVFRNCCAKHTVTLMNNSLYRCPFSANAENLHALPDSHEDSVCILNPPDQGRDLSLLNQDVLAFLSQQQPLHACDYCEGRPFGASEIEPAVQTPYPVEYQKLRCVSENQGRIDLT